MLSKCIYNIFKDARISILSDSDGELIKSKTQISLSIVLFLILPLIFSAVAWCRNIKLSSLETFIGTGIAIFTGLFFSLLIIIGDKVNKEKNNPDSDHDNFQHFKNNMKQIAHIVLFTILLGISIFILILINDLFKSSSCELIEKLLTVGTLFLLVQYLSSLIYIIQRYYYVVKDEINNIL